LRCCDIHTITIILNQKQQHMHHDSKWDDTANTAQKMSKASTVNAFISVAVLYREARQYKIL
jgi:hypothetical protein